MREVSTDPHPHRDPRLRLAHRLSLRHGAGNAVPRLGNDLENWQSRDISSAVGVEIIRRAFIALFAGAVARPRSALTQQQTKVYRIAVVHPSDPVSQMTETGGVPHYQALLHELRLLGCVEGQNLVVEGCSGEGRVLRAAGP